MVKLPRTKHGPRPWIFLNIATTADGKLAPSNRKFVPFGSKRDKDLMMELRTEADAVMSGARTVDAVPVNLGPGSAKYRQMRLEKGLSEYNIRVIVSGSATISPAAEIWKHRFSPIIVLTTENASKKRVATLEKLGAIVAPFGETKLDFTATSSWLYKEWGVKRLLCEGGGGVNAALFEEDLVDEIYLTLCPLIFGGRNAPTMSDGEGVERLAGATRLKLTSRKLEGDELFLVYRVIHKSFNR